jgi:predicted nucleic acid-binding protein
VKVIDAGVIVELIANDLDPDRLGDEELAVPHLIDSEVTDVLRRLVAQRVLSLDPPCRCGVTAGAST